MLIRSRALVALLFTGIALAGCNSGSSTPSATTCVVPSGTQAALVYPASGATGVTDTLNGVILAVSSTAPYGTFNIVLGNGSTALYLAQFLPYSGALPAGSATPPFANPSYLISNNTSGSLTNAFLSGSTLGAYINDLANNTCVPGGTPLGTFTIQ